MEKLTIAKQIGTILNVEINALDDSYVAERISTELDIAKENLLSNGWYFNQQDVLLTPNVDSFIVLPTDVLSVNTRTPRYVLRGRKIFDTVNLTYAFTSDTKIPATLILNLDYPDLNSNACNYIRLKTALTLSSAFPADSGQIEILRSELRDAYLTLSREHARTNKFRR